MERIKVIKKIIAYISLLLLALYVMSDSNGIINKITFGLFSWPIFDNIHFYFELPLVIFLLAHLFLALNLQDKLKREKELNRL
ncbi:MAG: hypothetical protein PVJ67_06935 [Candidatus Pacearchaeota archaeon]|jgi:hypothetical protein